MESTNRFLSLWPGFLLWASLRESVVSRHQSNRTIVIHPCLLKQRCFSLIFFKFKQHHLLNEYWKHFPGLQPLRLGISSLRKQEPLSLGTGTGLCQRADEQQDMHWPQRAAARPWVWGTLHALTAAPAAPKGAIVCHPRCVPASCSWVHRRTELALAQGSVSLQLSAGSSVFPLVSISYLKDSRRSSWHQQAGLGAAYMKWGCQPKSSVWRCTEQSPELAAHSAAVSNKGTRVFQRDNCKLAFLGWGIKSRHSCPTPSSWLGLYFYELSNGY